MLGLVSMASLLKIRRSPHHCVRCHQCEHRCPANLPIMLGTTVRSPECFACYRCVDGCPAPGALALADPGKRSVPAWLTGALMTGVLMVGISISILF
jgi:NAD-dependent dihydropyrimidine dehydrogenase PreA subunit